MDGGAKTSTIFTISPEAANLEETLSTLDYALRVKNIRNRSDVYEKSTTKRLLEVQVYTSSLFKTLRVDIVL